jgi:hypothetical protein
LIPIDTSRIKFLRMRPANFPTIRLSQMANLIFNSRQLFSKILDTASSIQDTEKLLNAVASEYWKTRYTFQDDKHEESDKKVGKTAVHHIIINTIVPILYVYGKKMREEKYCDQAIQLLHALPAEKNKYTSEFAAIGYAPFNAFQSQAIIEQFTSLCANKKCLECSLGFKVVKGK